MEVNLVRWHNLKSGRLFGGYFFLTLALTAFAVAPLLYPGYFETHSGFVPIWNVMDLRGQLANFTWLPTQAADFNVWRSDGLLPYYLAALLPTEPVTAVKIVMGVGLILGAGGLFLWLQPWLGDQGATLAALVYTYLPFTLATIYVRGAWGETLFWGFVPWGLGAAARSATAPRWLQVIAVVVIWAGLGLSQLGLSLWLWGFLVVLLLGFQRRLALQPVFAAGVGLGLAAGLTLVRAPAVDTSIDPHLLTEHLVYPAQLFSAFWGYGVSQPGWDDGLSLGLGLAAVGASMLAVFVWNVHGDRNERRPVFLLAAALVVLVLITPVSDWLGVWQAPGLASTLTFPWQLLGLAGLCLAILSGVGPWLDERLRAMPAFAVLIVFVLLASYQYLAPQFTQRPPVQGPQAILGEHQAAILAYDLAVEISGGITGLERTRTTLALADYGPPKPGDVLQLRVDWQALQPFSSDLKVFVHLVDSQGRVLAQADVQPHTSTWIPGHVVEATYRLTVPVDSPSRPARLYLGLYEADTLERLSVAGDDQGRVVIEVP